MDTAKLFIALNIEQSYIKDIFRDFESLDLPWEKIKKVDPDTLHLTLKYLGPTTIDKIPAIIEALESVELNAQEMSISIDKTAIFNKKNPRVLSLTLENNEILQNLYEQIDRKLFEANVSNMDIRQFKPHLTLARIKKSSDRKEFQPYLSWAAKKDFLLTHFELIESVPSKASPIFSTLQTFEL